MKTTLSKNRTPTPNHAFAGAATTNHALTSAATPSSTPSLAAQPLSMSSFNPALPQDGALVIAGVLRDQFNGLATMIEEVPVLDAATVDAVNTLPPGDPATAGVSVTDATLHFTFGIPQGATGPQGSQGEVSQAALDTAIAGTSSNSNGVSTFSQGADASYSQPQMQALFDKLDELITALRRV